MQCIGQSNKVRRSSEVGVYVVYVCCPVAVVRIAVLSVRSLQILDNRADPDCSEAHVLNVVELAY